MTSKSTTSHEVKRFVRAARSYCEFCEDKILRDEDGAIQQDEWLRTILTALTELYSAALHLPPTSEWTIASDDILPDEYDVPTDTKDEIHRKVASRFGLKESHVIWVWDENTSKPEPLTYSMGDALSDVYSDVKEGLNAWKEGEDLRVDVLWDWAFSFDSHWGAHAAFAIAAIHSLVFSMPAFFGMEPQD